METSNENLQPAPISSNDNDHQNNDTVASVLNHRGAESEHDISREEIKHILKVIASTGRFWHDWDKLKSMLSIQLKQVLSEYPEAKMTSEQQYASLGESYSDLVNKLDEALLSFYEGPPFTLQRLCEILLDAQNIYPNLLKLALALEKNLLVTSTLTICTDPYPQTTVQESDESEKAIEKQDQEPNITDNGIEPLAADKDVVMTEADIGDEMTIDMEAFEDMVKPSEANSEPTANANA
ncbi:hypothetical protein QN277_009127 [Acacia crassicarpa]|uniref:Serine/threonine-protein phosphatase 4 regulatory subunit 2 n=1 Tax=Acacia crassicarpa TaxID=499986 RepID=A0AAE1JNA0_9FABA|nr:hypothetical protein QN277_009127 [Acacia crassicarpa]